jgi:hypothetical protein
VEGDGNINAFDPVTGAYLGQLQHPDGTPIAIAGLWDLTFGGGSHDNGLSKQLYFDAGPNVPNPAGNGLFGRIIAAGNQRNGQGVGTDNAAVSAAKTTIVGLAPLPSATATDPEATAYGWLLDIAPLSSDVFTTSAHQGKSNTINGKATLRARAQPAHRGLAQAERARRTLEADASQTERSGG